MTLDADEFMRRFLMHVLPKGFRRIRHFGFLANACRVEKLARIRAALAFPAPERAAEPEDYRERCAQLTGKRIDICPFAAAEWSTSAHGLTALRHGRLPTATRHDAEPGDPASASDQHPRVRGAAPHANNLAP